MKIRNILFGYRYTEGKLVFHPTESEVMKEIYKAYLEGNSLLKLSERLNERQIEYMPGVVGWNKSRIMRLLSDQRYMGNEKYPALIDRKTYEAIQTLKDEKYLQKDLERQADIFQITIPVRCPNCSGMLRRKADNRRKTAVWWKCLTPNCKTNIGKTDESLIEELTEVMNELIADPDRVDIPPEKDPEPSIELRRLNNEIARLLDSIQINRDTVREKIIEYASLKYAEFDSVLGKAQRVKDIFKTAAPLKKFSSELLERTVDEIRMYADGRIGIVLENKQEIRHRG